MKQHSGSSTAIVLSDMSQLQTQNTVSQRLALLKTGMNQPSPIEHTPSSPEIFAGLFRLELHIFLIQDIIFSGFINLNINVNPYKHFLGIYHQWKF